MSFGRKINAAAIFALTIIDVLAGFSRNIVMVFAASQVPGDLLWGVQLICSVVEPGLAAIVCSLPVYPALVIRFRSNRREKLEIQHHAANIGAKRWLPHKLRLLTASFPGPFLEISILGPAQNTEHHNEEVLIEAPEAFHVVEGEEERQS